MEFTKMQGSGNDFVVIDTDDVKTDWAKTSIAMCDRHYGIGADGVLLMLPSDKADFRMRIFNADGTEAEACGNGIRCLVRHYADANLGSWGAKEVSIETMAGIRKAQVNRVAGETTRIRVGMGRPGHGNGNTPVITEAGNDKQVDITSMRLHSVTVDGQTLNLSVVSIGNSHAVYFSQQPVSEFPLLQLGPQVEHHKTFPKGVNFEVARVLDRQQIEARVWERGVGETLACGSGACAITVAAQLQGYIGKEAKIKLPGGTLETEWDGEGEVFLSGPAETVFVGEWS